MPATELREALQRGNQKRGRFGGDGAGQTTGAAGLPLPEVIFHATTVHASGGLMLSGDDLTTMTPDRTALLKKLIPPTGRAAAFADETLGAGRTPLGNGENLYLFNWGDQPAERVVKFRGTRRLTDHWTGKSLGEFTDEYRVPALPGRTAMLIEAMPVK